ASFLSLITPWIAGSNPINSHKKTDADNPNVLKLVFDTLSALNVSLYGYHRKTMPNLERFAERATVFHNHYSGGNFTTPGTSSILTGTLPWTHRAFSHNATPLDFFTTRNIFSEFGDDKYTRVGFSHNLLVNIILSHLRQDLDLYTLPNEIALVDFNISDNLFKKDYGIAAQSERTHYKNPGDLSNSLFIFPFFWSLKIAINRYLRDRLRRKFPRGIPGYHDMLYPLEDTIDWIIKQCQEWSQPFFSYLHMMPPHDPYTPRKEFVNIFWDGWQPTPKPDHFFANFSDRQDMLNEKRVFYDEYIAYVDAEFGRLHDAMESSGLYDNTIVVFTSDHGEMFERKIWKHTTPTLFQPIIRVPLLISLPGQTSRQDVYTATSCVDLLPTLLHLTGRTTPTWTEGQILPPYAQNLPPDRSLFVVEAKSNPRMQPLRKATVAMIKGDYKLIHYRGYEGYDGVYELYNLHDDPEELENLYATHPTIASDLKQEMLSTITEKDEPFTKQ
ncbi:MAG: sulfatase-like hydrolase/transferase, partial [Anaerolineales bacterium]